MEKLQISFLLAPTEVASDLQGFVPRSRPSKQKRLEERLQKEINLLKDELQKWCDQELFSRSSEEGYRCFWTRTCSRSIKGKANFKKHLLWHFRRFYAGYRKLIKKHSDWNCLSMLLGN